jgi:hypothetical protein
VHKLASEDSNPDSVPSGVVPSTLAHNCRFLVERE